MQSVVSLVNTLRSGVLPLKDYIGEIQATYQQREPMIEAFLPEPQRFDRLFEQAAELERLHPQPINRPPLYGILLGIKDIFHVDDFDTHAGSKLPVESLQGREALTVSTLKRAGGLIMGKTETTEFAYFGPGPTRNPHALEHTPGGSSSGSAAAVAAGLCPIALGTQTIGSVTRPAAYCGVIGYKPSYDRITRSGVIPLAPSLDHVGIFSSDISGVDLVASLLCPDWHIAVNEELPVLGVPIGPYLDNLSSEGWKHFEETISRLNAAGCQIKRVEAMPDFDEIVSRHRVILAAEAAQVHASWYAEYKHLYHHQTKELIKEGRSISVGVLAEALTGRARLRRQLTELMDHHSLDLWITPAAPGPAPRGLDTTGDPIMNLPWSHCGLPTIALPTGKNEEGLPMALQIAGRWYEDERLMEWSAELETRLADLK